MRLKFDNANLEKIQTYNNNNNNTLIYIAPACRMTSEALFKVIQGQSKAHMQLPISRY